MTAGPDIITFARERAGDWLGDLGNWSSWFTFLRALSALPLDEDERRLVAECTGNRPPPTAPVREAVVIAGRRSRKSAMAALIAVYRAVAFDYRPYLAPGAVARVVVVAVDKDQAAEVLTYVRGILDNHPALARRVVKILAHSVLLNNHLRLEVLANSFRGIRGKTVVCAIFDELAFWRSDESANPDKEVLRAIRPAMATIPNSLLLMISSPYGRRGLLWERFRDHYGKDSPVLVWRAPTATMNPLVDRAEIEAAYADDPVAASSEWGAEFRDDIGGFLDAELLAGLVRSAPQELPPVQGKNYVVFVDPSGGRGDAFALAIGHREADGRVVLDLVRQRKAPFDPGMVVADYACLLRDYSVRQVSGDHYSAEWVASSFREAGMEYRPSALPKSQIYLEALPLFTRGQVELPDERMLLVQLASLERRSGRGRDIVDHPPGASDDAANAVCGVLTLAGASDKALAALDKLIERGFRFANLPKATFADLGQLDRSHPAVPDRMWS